MNDTPFLEGHSTGLVDEVNLDKTVVLGELSLDGSINGVRGVLPCVCAAKEEGIEKILIPDINVNEGKIVDSMHVIAADSLRNAVRYINDGIMLNDTPFLEGHSTTIFSAMFYLFSKHR